MKPNCFFIAGSLFGLVLATKTQQPLLGNTKWQSSESPIDALDHIIDTSPLLSLHRNLVQIQSESGHEAAVADFLLEFLALHNLTVEKQIVTPESELERERYNIFAYSGASRFPDVLLTSHVDTVPPFIPYSLHPPVTHTTTKGEVNRSKVIIAGRGTVDAKASVASIIFGTLETLKANPEASIGLLFDVGEENSGIGMKHFSSSDLNPSPSRLKTVVFGEPTGLNLVAGHKGTLGFKLIARGKAAHSGYPWLGRSAVSSLLPVLYRLDTLQDLPSSQGGLLSSQKFGNSTLNIGVVRGGLAGNIVPAYAEATITIRIAAGGPEDTRQIIHKAVKEVTGGDENIWLDFGPPDSGAAPQHLDTDVDGFEVITVNYGTDIPSLKIHEGGSEVKRYLYGPGNFHLAHADTEAITVGELEAAVEGYKKLISNSLGLD